MTWIPADKELPPNCSPVVVFTKQGDMFIGCIEGGRWWKCYGTLDYWDDHWEAEEPDEQDDHTSYNITHWHPLPEPPK